MIVKTGVPYSKRFFTMAVKTENVALQKFSDRLAVRTASIALQCFLAFFLFYGLVVNTASIAFNTRTTEGVNLTLLFFWRRTALPPLYPKICYFINFPNYIGYLLCQSLKSGRFTVFEISPVHPRSTEGSI